MADEDDQILKVFKGEKGRNVRLNSKTEKTKAVVDASWADATKSRVDIKDEEDDTAAAIVSMTGTADIPVLDTTGLELLVDKIGALAVENYYVYVHLINTAETREEIGEYFLKVVAN